VNPEQAVTADDADNDEDKDDGRVVGRTAMDVGDKVFDGVELEPVDDVEEEALIVTKMPPGACVEVGSDMASVVKFANGVDDVCAVVLELANIGEVSTVEVDVESGSRLLVEIAAAVSEVLSGHTTCGAGAGPEVRGLQPGSPPGSIPWTGSFQIDGASGQVRGKLDVWLGASAGHAVATPLLSV
jgi:hypothetical protein